MFTKSVDGRKHPIRGLWQRNERYYAQLKVFDPITGKKRAQRIPLKDKDGQPVTTIARAVAVMEALRTKRRDTGLEVQRSRAPKFAAYCDSYLEAIIGSKKPRVIVGEKAMLTAWRKHLGDIQLNQIRKVHVNDFITKRLKAGRSPRTCNLNVVILRNVLRRAIDDGYLNTMPIAGVRPLKVTTRKKTLFTADEIDKVIAAAFQTRTNDEGEMVAVTENAQLLADYLRFLQFTGAREKEALRVRWEDVDFERGLVTIGADGDSKNRQARHVDFNQKLEAHLREMKKRSGSVSAWVFPSPQRGEKDVPARTLRQSLNFARHQAGLPKFSFHDLRHAFISTCVMSGLDFMTIASWVGHRDGGILIGKVYGHLADSHKKQAALKVNFGPVVLDVAKNQ